MKYYRVSEEFLRELLLAAHTYHALESGGVDNWEWYGASIEDYIKDCGVIDETHYEDIEDIVEADLMNCSECHCDIPELQAMPECLPSYEEF